MSNANQSHSIPAAVLLLTVFVFPLQNLSAAGGNVWTVGPGKDFAQIQDAVLNAANGDTLLVYYPGPAPYNPVQIDNKGLVLAADSASIEVRSIAVENIQKDQVVVLSGFQGTELTDPFLILKDNYGSIRVHDVFSNFNAKGDDCVRIDNCPDVAIINGYFKGAEGKYPGGRGGHGILAVDSTVACFGCKIVGGLGAYGDTHPSRMNGGPGGDGYHMKGGFLFASGSYIRGGGGGTGGSPSFGKGGDGGDGGSGLVIQDTAEAQLRACSFHCGLGGLPGCGDIPGVPGYPGKQIAGTGFHLLPGTYHAIVMPNLARENEQITIGFWGTTGDVVGLFISSHPDTQFIPVYKGQLLLSAFPPPVFLFIGVMPSNPMTWSPAIPDLSPGFTAETLFFQSIHLAASGDVTLGSFRSMVVLNEMF